MDKEGIKTVIHNVLDKLTVVVDEISVIENKNGIVFMIQTNEPSLLIGINGATLIALNHIIKRIIERGELSPEKNFIVDVNNYQKQRNDSLMDKVKVITDNVKSNKVDIEMEPMSSYERMVVHSTLADDPEISTESFGVGMERKVVIKYKIDKGDKVPDESNANKKPMK